MAPLLALESRVLRDDFDRNVVTALHLIRNCAPSMVISGGGSIVCISSTAGGFSFPFMASYAVAKAALESLVRVAADELGGVNVRVNAVRPGLVPTQAAKPGIIASDPAQREKVLREKPLARVGTTEDVARAVRYLVGPESSWVTGTVIPVDGGNHLRRAADLEILARAVCGDAVVDAARHGVRPHSGSTGGWVPVIVVRIVPGAQHESAATRVATSVEEARVERRAGVDLAPVVGTCEEGTPPWERP